VTRTVSVTTDNAEPVGTVQVADRFWRRLRGLMFRRSLARGEGLLFPDCRNIHTFGMRMDIDIVFLNGDSIVRVVHNAVPNRVYAARGACDVLELSKGLAAEIGIRPGIRLRFAPSYRSDGSNTAAPAEGLGGTTSIREAS